MIKQIRYGTFETNSSSSHSFTLGSLDSVVSPPNVEQCSFYNSSTGTLEMPGDEYGWGPARLDNWSARLNYLLTQNMGNENRLETIIQVVEEFLGYPVIFIGCDNWDSKNWAYIDHESQGITGDIITKESILAFVFGNTEVLIDNDNSWHFGSPYGDEDEDF